MVGITRVYCIAAYAATIRAGHRAAAITLGAFLLTIITESAFADEPMSTPSDEGAINAYPDQFSVERRRYRPAPPSPSLAGPFSRQTARDAELLAPCPEAEAWRQAGPGALAETDRRSSTRRLISRLREIEEVPFVTVWRKNDAKVFFGLNDDGRPGIHLKRVYRPETAVGDVQ